MQNSKIQYVVFPFFLAGLVFIHYGLERSQSMSLMATYGGLLLIYGIMLRYQYPVLIIFLAGLICRIALFGALPNLSDDFYRFLWDGELLTRGINPYISTPASFTATDQFTGIWTSQLYPFLNSPNYFTVYPPLAQYLFAASASLSDNIFWNTSLLRFLFLIGEACAFFLIYQLAGEHLSKPTALHAYFLNPLVILEVTGNLHLEGLMLTFILVGLYFLKQEKYTLTGLGIGSAVAIKIIPLAFIPVFLFKKTPRQWIKIFVPMGLLMITLTLPLLSIDFIIGLSESLSLFIQKFEFNASFYYLFREIGYWVKGYNIIGTLGPWLSIATATGIFLYAFLSRNRHALATQFLFIWMIYLSLASIVHPWYIIPMIGISLFTPFRFPIVWSGLIFLSYIGYDAKSYTQPYAWIGVEYIIVYAYLLYELWSLKKQPIET